MFKFLNKWYLLVWAAIIVFLIIVYVTTDYFSVWAEPGGHYKEDVGSLVIYIGFVSLGYNAVYALFYWIVWTGFLVKNKHL